MIFSRHNDDSKFVGLLTEDDEFWLTWRKEIIKDSLRAVEDAAKQLITVASFSQTVYFTAISLSTVKQGLWLLADYYQRVFLFMLSMPFLLWSLTLVYAIDVLLCRTYKDPGTLEGIRKWYLKLVKQKYPSLIKAYWFLVLGFPFLLINIIIYFLYF